MTTHNSIRVISFRLPSVSSPSVTWQFEDKEPTDDDLEEVDDGEAEPESLLSACASLTVSSLFSLGSPKLESLLAKSSAENVTVL